jgi:hypothetical protein
MIVYRETLIDAPASQCIAAVMTPALLRYVASPWLSFEPVADMEWPTRWVPGPFPVRMKLFGWLPLGVQTIDISLPAAPSGRFQVRDNGHSALIERWDHFISIEAIGNRTRYSDRVDIRAGCRTPFVWLFARWFCAHRQRRWQRLAASGGLAGFARMLSS